VDPGRSAHTLAASTHGESSRHAAHAGEHHGGARAVGQRGVLGPLPRPLHGSEGPGRRLVVGALPGARQDRPPAAHARFALTRVAPRRATTRRKPAQTALTLPERDATVRATCRVVSSSASPADRDPARPWWRATSSAIWARIAS